MHTNRSFRCSLRNGTESRANPAEANFSANLGKCSQETICGSFLVKGLLSCGACIHHHFLFVREIPAPCIIQCRTKENEMHPYWAITEFYFAFQTIGRTMRTESCLMLLRPVNLPWSTRAALWQMPLALDRSITDNFDIFGNNEHLFLLFPQGRENIQDTFPCHQHQQALRSFQAGFTNSPRG